MIRRSRPGSAPRTPRKPGPDDMRNKNRANYPAAFFPSLRRAAARIHPTPPGGALRSALDGNALSLLGFNLAGRSKPMLLVPAMRLALCLPKGVSAPLDPPLLF